MPIPVTDYISTTDPSDTYATHASQYGKGGWHEVADNTARDSIPEGRRTAGMAVYVTSTGKLWILGPDLLTWTEFAGGTGGGSGTTDTLTIEAGEDLVAGTPVYVATNKVYAANSATHGNIVGLVATNVLTGFLADIVTDGQITLSGLSSGSPYFLGNGVITPTAPTAGYVVRVGTAVKSDTLIVNIEEPILLV